METQTYPAENCYTPLYPAMWVQRGYKGSGILSEIEVIAMEYTKEELLEAKRQIDSTLHKLRATIVTLQGKENPARYKSQITLAQRRVKAFEIAVGLIEKELE
ncbi:MAG: hypothetical protein MSS94_04140 [Clostridiales bacterium]|nr:hypothetical protein [Clostridiales bacterium]